MKLLALIPILALLVPNIVLGATVTFQNPTWGTLENAGVTSGQVSASSSIPLGYQGSLDTVTAFELCDSYGYSLLSFITGSNEDPTVTWDSNNDYWEDDGSEPIFLQVSCDNGLNETQVEVTVDNIGDILVMMGVQIALLSCLCSLLVFGRN